MANTKRLRTLRHALYIGWLYLSDVLRWPFLVVLGMLPTYLLFFRLNRVSVSGRHHVPRGVRVILASRHQSMLDSFPVTLASMHLEDLFLPWNLPYHTADALNYVKNPLAAAWGWTMKILPIKRVSGGARVDFKNLIRMTIRARYSRIFVFPGGTREKHNRPLRPTLGIGHAAVETGAAIVPIWIDGMHEVLPIGCNRPRIRKQIRIVFGPPVYYQDLLDADPSRSRDTKMAIALRVTRAIYALSERPESNPEILEPQQRQRARG